MEKYCQSCGGPLDIIGAHKKNENFCQYCADTNGELQPREAVKAGITEWLKSWSTEKEGVDFSKRAEFYMNAMPAWNQYYSSQKHKKADIVSYEKITAYNTVFYNNPYYIGSPAYADSQQILLLL